MDGRHGCQRPYVSRRLEANHLAEACGIIISKQSEIALECFPDSHEEDQ